MRDAAVDFRRARFLLTVDYELFGNGGGNVDCCVISPANRIREIAEKYNAKVTLFVDALEFLAIQRVPTFRSQSEKIVEQLRSFVAAGHRVELHLHPQWLNARWDGGAWQLDNGNWRIGDLSYKDASLAFRHGHDWLVDVLSAVDSNYRIVAFRAGGWCIQPSHRVLGIMQELDIPIDSSVAPGMANSVTGKWFDFRKTPTAPFWQVDNDVCKEQAGGKSLEVPIASARLPLPLHITSLLKSSGRLAEGCKGSYSSEKQTFFGRFAKLRKLSGLGSSMLDFCTLTPKAAQYVANGWVASQPDDAMVVPLVSIGHTKNFSELSGRTLNGLLDWAKVRNIRFSDYNEISGEINVNHS